MKTILALVALSSALTPTFAAPPMSPTGAAPKMAPVSAAQVRERQKVVAFLDGIAATHRNLRSLSATYKRTGYDPASGNFAVLHSKPVKVRYEEKGTITRQVFVSDGVRNHRVVHPDWGDVLDTLWTPPYGIPPSGDVQEIRCDAIIPVLLSGQNPLRTLPWGLTNGKPLDNEASNNQARLLPSATVRGVRCRGVQWKQLEREESRDATTSFTNVYALWFDARGLLRQSRTSIEGTKGDIIVDFDMTPNAKLSPALFTIPNRPDDKN